MLSLGLCLMLAAAPERVVDSGTFAVTVGGKRAGRETFTLVEQGDGFELRTTLNHGAGRAATMVRGALRTDKQFRPLSGSFELFAPRQRKQLTLTRNGDLPELTVELGARTALHTRPKKPSDLYVMDNPLAVGHLAPLCRMAKGPKKGLVAFPAAPVEISEAKEQSFPHTKLGAPAFVLSSLIVDVAQTTRYELVCDGDKLVAVRHRLRGLVAVRASYEPIASALQSRVQSKPTLPGTVVELPRKVAVPGGAALACALTLPRSHADVKRADVKRPKDGALGPKGSPATGAMVVTGPALQPLPAVLLVGDAGLHDRDGDSIGAGDPTLSLLKTMAIRLGEAGIAALRCDDRGAARGATAAQPTLPALAADARAMMAALRREPAVAPDAIALFGHGEGGLVSALVAEKDPQVRALALIATPGRPFDTVVLEQAEASMRRFGYPDEEIQQALAEDRALYEAIRGGKRLPKTLSRAEDRGIRGALAWLRSHLAHDPAAVMKRLRKMPVFIAQGGRDVQVSTKDAERLREALAGAVLTTRTYPTLNHAFAHIADGGLADYLDPRASVAEPFLADLVQFAKTIGRPTPTTALAK